MEDVLVPVFVCGILFIALPWLVMHYVTKWKQAPGSMTGEDEALLDELHALARRLEERVVTVERIIAADDPGFRPAPATYREDDGNARPRERSFDGRN